MQNFKQGIQRIIMLNVLLGSVIFVNAQQASAGKLEDQFITSPPVESFSAGIREEDSSSLKFKVWFLNPQEEKVNISIRSESGNIFSKNFTDNWYAQVYDLGELEDGIYTISISKGKKNFEKKVMISSETYVVRKKLLY